MNIILVLVDSLNKHMLEPYGGGPEGLTPNMKRFAEEAIRFDGHYVGSLPCMPARREIFSGRKDFLWRPWGHLEAFDRPLPRELARGGYKTELITDHYHYWEDNAHGYLESFQGTEFIRGHELDPWRIDPVAALPDWAQVIERYRPGQGLLYYRNVQDFQDERDFFPAKVFSSAAKWVENNHDSGPFFLQVESFDVHEPFHCPEPYRSMWTDETHGIYNCWPPYQITDQMERFFDETSPAELHYLRSQYMGKLTMVDRWLGHFMDELDRLAVWDDTVVILTSDHGHDLGERRTFGKLFPHFDSHANIPLLVRHPHFRNPRGTDALTSTVDLYATILDVAGITDVQPAHSQSILPIVEGKTSSLRQSLLFGTFGMGACCTNGEWLYVQGFDNDRHPLYTYTGRLLPVANGRGIEGGHFIPDVDFPVWRIPLSRANGNSGSYLIRTGSKPGEECNVLEREPEVAAQMQAMLRTMLQEEGAPAEQYARLGL